MQGDIGNTGDCYGFGKTRAWGADGWRGQSGLGGLIASSMVGGITKATRGGGDSCAGAAPQVHLCVNFDSRLLGVGLTETGYWVYWGAARSLDGGRRRAPSGASILLCPAAVIARGRGRWRQQPRVHLRGRRGTRAQSVARTFPGPRLRGTRRVEGGRRRRVSAQLHPQPGHPPGAGTSGRPTCHCRAEGLSPGSPKQSGRVLFL